MLLPPVPRLAFASADDLNVPNVDVAMPLALPNVERFQVAGITDVVPTVKVVFEGDTLKEGELYVRLICKAPDAGMPSVNVR